MIAILLGIIAAGFGLALISLIEAAIVSVSPFRLRQLSEESVEAAHLVEEITAETQETLGGLIVATNVLVLLIANLTTLLATNSHIGNAAVIWLNAVVLIALLLFTQIVPKTISVYYAEAITLRTIRVIHLINTLFAPIIWLLNGISLTLLRLLTFLHILSGRVRPVPTAYSEEDIKELVSAGEQTGAVEATEREMIHGVIEFSETTAGEIMVPRTDLIALPIDTTLEEAIQAFIASGHSRIPVYEDNADNILGLLYIKDLLIRFRAAEQSGHPLPSLPQLIRPAYFVPESKKSDELLREMQRKQVHMAVVVDEYGGTAGIITIEDLLEEIVGDIIDEYDKEHLEIQILPEGTAVVLGRTSLEKIEETFDIDLPDTEAETISGLITEILGRIPEVDDQITIAMVRFIVVEVAHNRVERLLAKVLPPHQLPEKD